MKHIIYLCLLSVYFFSCTDNKEKPSGLSLLTKCKPDGSPDSVYCGTLEVFENRITNSGRKISLYVIVIPAIDSTAKEAPVFIIEGGPGVAATNGLSFYAMRDNVYRQRHDVLLIDVRGTGKSNPLNCASLQYKAGLEDHFKEMYPIKDVKDCYDSLSAIADLRQYTTENVVKDLEEVRQWLGYEKAHLFGLSYGTRVVQVYMKMFPGSVASSVLWSPVVMNGKIPLYHARFAQDAMNLLFEDCSKDSLCSAIYPDIKSEFTELMNKWNQQSFTYKWKNEKDEKKEVRVSWDAFQTKIRSLGYSPAGMRMIPYLVHEAWKGNLQPFINLFPKESVMDDFIAEGFYLCITCSEDIPFIKKDDIAAQTSNTFMGTYRIDQQLQACAVWAKGKVADDFREPVKSDIPTLIISGSFDPVTPPAWAKDIASHLSNCIVVTIPQMSHMFDGLSNEECFDKLVVDFISNPAKINADCIEQMKPPPYKIR
ncbi:MAG: alpha/beta fold hydrolase [Chitinophagaceae bacterium]|nr:alpha/beta fold hydrolase [Chitinophagaceae bacterium]